MVATVVFTSDAKVGLGGPSDQIFTSGYEAQINSSGRDTNKTGSLYGGGNIALVSILESPAPPGQWFTMDVSAETNSIQIKVNGKTTANYTDEGWRFSRGHIALQQHDPQTIIEFRKIEIRELNVARTKPQ